MNETDTFPNIANNTIKSQNKLASDTQINFSRNAKFDNEKNYKNIGFKNKK